MFSLGDELSAKKTVKNLKTRFIFSHCPHNSFMVRGKSRQCQALQSRSIQIPSGERPSLDLYTAF